MSKGREKAILTTIFTLGAVAANKRLINKRVMLTQGKNAGIKGSEGVK